MNNRATDTSGNILQLTTGQLILVEKPPELEVPGPQLVVCHVTLPHPVTSLSSMLFNVCRRPYRLSRMGSQGRTPGLSHGSWALTNPVKYSAKSTDDKLQLNTHTPYLCGFEWNDTVNWFMVERCTWNLCQDSSISRGISHATTKEP